MQNGTTASFPSIASLLKICTSAFHLQQVHAQIVRRGLEQDHVLVSQLMVSLSKTHLSGLEDHYTIGVFDRVLRPGTGLWNVLVKGFVEKGRFGEAVSSFVRMKREDCFADGFTYPLLIKLCASEVRVREGRAFHGSALRCGVVHSDVFVRTSLIDFYGKCDDVVSARKLFDEMPFRNVVSWTAMVVGYVASEDLAEAKKLFDEMPLRNSITWNAMIDGFVKSGDLPTARRIFDEMPEKNAVSFATMIDGYAKSGNMSCARFLFDRASKKDNFALSALISGYARNGQLSEAISVFSASETDPDEHVIVSLIKACSKEGDPELAKWVDDHVSNKIPINLYRAHVNAALIDMNAKSGNLDRAKFLFEQTPNRDMISYCSMIHGLSIHGRGKEAVSLFDQMVNDGFVPDEVAFTVVLTACSRAGLVAEGLRYFESLAGDASPEHYSVIVDLLGRSGDLKTGFELLRWKPIGPRVGAWAALLGACRLHGDAELGEIVAARVLEAEPRSSGNYVLLSQIYAERERWLDVCIVRDRMKEKGVRKLPGLSSMRSTQG